MRIELFDDGQVYVYEPYKEFKDSFNLSDEHGVEEYEESGGGTSYRPVGREYADSQRDPFLWVTDKGKALQVEEMATPHLINAINMIWRNVFRIKEDRPEIREDWAAAYVDRAAKELTAELQRRVEEA